MTRKKSVVKILLVDDLEENLLSLAALLRADDLEILQAKSGTQALEILLEHDVALALLDVQMPEMDGYELAELMRGAARTRHIPIIFVTAGARETGRVFRGYEAGAVDYLLKPLEPRVLLTKVNIFVELYRQRLELAELLRLNEELLAVVSHDLRNPLNVVVMVAQLLHEYEDPSITALANRLQSSGDRMKTIISELFDLTRARLAGGIPVDASPMDLQNILLRVVGEVEANAKGRRIDLRKRGDLTGTWDGSRLEQVLSNLLGNAVAHGANEHPIVVDVDGQGHELCINITNGGVIPPELLPHVFAPFRGSNDGKRKREGLGLGLYIVDQIVRAHGGEIRIDTHPERGTTTFAVRLPRVAPRA